MAESRHRNMVERIGKKYQWIALYEFLARAADRYPLFGEAWSDKATTVPYQYPAQLIYYCPYDTSLLRARDPDQRELTSDGWWSRRGGPSLWDGEPGDEWLRSASGVPDPRGFVVQEAPGSGRRAAMLAGYLSWQEADPQDVTERPKSRRVFLHAHAFCVRAADFNAVRKWAQGMSFNGERPPEPQHLSGSMFCELYWSRSARAECESSWQNPDRWRGGIPCAVLPLAAQYVNEADPTVGSSLHALVPSRWVVETLGLTAGPEDLVFRDDSGKQVCWNPSVPAGGSDAVFCELERLAASVETQGLRLVWCVFGEKNAIDDLWRPNGPRWPFVRGFFWLEAGTVKGGHDVVLDRNSPSSDDALDAR
jgi:hypothetical protein